MPGVPPNTENVSNPRPRFSLCATPSGPSITLCARAGEASSRTADASRAAPRLRRSPSLHLAECHILPGPGTNSLDNLAVIITSIGRVSCPSEAQSSQSNRRPSALGGKQILNPAEFDELFMAKYAHIFALFVTIGEGRCSTECDPLSRTRSRWPDYQSSPSPVRV